MKKKNPRCLEMCAWGFGLPLTPYAQFLASLPSMQDHRHHQFAPSGHPQSNHQEGFRS
jgi:hypothetical protein